MALSSSHLYRYYSSSFSDASYFCAFFIIVPIPFIIESSFPIVQAIVECRMKTLRIQTRFSIAFCPCSEFNCTLCEALPKLLCYTVAKYVNASNMTIKNSSKNYLFISKITQKMTILKMVIGIVAVVCFLMLILGRVKFCRFLFQSLMRDYWFEILILNNGNS